MITTGCRQLNWMISKATEYDKSEEHTVYRFRGTVQYRMICEVIEWMRCKNARYSDGRSRSGWSLTIEDRVDLDRKWYNHTAIYVSRGVYRSTHQDVEVLITVYDCPISDEDIAEMMDAIKVAA